MILSIKEIIEKAKLKISKDRIFYGELMKNYTSFKIGGPAECLIKIEKKKN